MSLFKKKNIKLAVILLISLIVIAISLAAFAIFNTRGRTLVQFDIHQNKSLIYLSTFSEPPQFAIWIENAKTHECKTVFVTHRVAIGDWEGKANVPVALPQWFKTFRGRSSAYNSGGSTEKSDLAITGATPKEDFFTVRAEVEPGSEWICWIEMNLAGDFNDAYPEFNMTNLKEDEFSCGQPALLYKAEIKAEENLKFTPVLTSQDLWSNGEVTIEPVSDGVTTAKEVFDNIQISIMRPKPKLIDKYKIKNL
jgi:uncharacterized protein (UPF0333 family)